MDFQQLLDWIGSFWGSVLFLTCHIVVAATVSWDALFRKTRPSSTLLWMTFVWTTPILGTAFYVMFGVNRVARRAARDREDLSRKKLEGEPETSPPGFWPDRMQALARLINHDAAWKLTPGNRFEPLFNGEEAYPAMLSAIGGAKTSVFLQTYIFDREGPGEEFADALEKAEKRGVDVRVIIDDASRFHANSPVDRLLRRKGVAETKFTPRRWWQRLLSINLRNHRKILVVDGVEAFTGGMNILPGHLPEKKPRHPIHDIHFRLSGPIVEHLLAVFLEDWEFCNGGSIPLPPRSQQSYAADGGAWACGIPDGPDEDYQKLSTVFAGALSCARKSVWIATPYFLPDEVLTSQLRLAAFRGAEVKILVPKNNNHGFVKWASESFYRPLIEAGCQIFETEGEFDHSKIFIVDGLFFSIGSANWDDRSLRLNYEFNVVGFESRLCEKLTAKLESRATSLGAPINAEWFEKRTRLQRIRSRFAWLLSPFL
ncbi:MAG: cardiolipin synthase [Verrucomicrobiales bacterium]|jgi:cardiolipin synthase